MLSRLTVCLAKTLALSVLICSAAAAFSMPRPLASVVGISQNGCIGSALALPVQQTAAVPARKRVLRPLGAFFDGKRCPMAALLRKFRATNRFGPSARESNHAAVLNRVAQSFSSLRTAMDVLGHRPLASHSRQCPVRILALPRR